MKKEVVGKVLKEVVDNYDFNRDIEAPVSELPGINNQIPVKGIIKLNEMGQYIEKMHGSLILKLSSYDRSSIYIKDEELQFINQLINDRVINAILSNNVYQDKKQLKIG